MNPCRRDPLATDAGDHESAVAFGRAARQVAPTCLFCANGTLGHRADYPENREARMASHWHTADGPSEIRHDDDIGYYGGWTISGLAVVATITAVWLFGI